MGFADRNGFSDICDSKQQSWALAVSCRAGHFRYFFIFSLIKNDFFALFIKLITYFCTSPI